MNLRYIVGIGLSFVFVALAAWAQSVDFDAESKGFSNLRQAGELVTLEVTPKGKEVRLKLVGKTGAKIKVDDLSLEATYGFGKVKRRVILTRQDNEFIIKRDKVKPMDLQIRVMTEDQAEDFNFKLK